MKNRVVNTNKLFKLARERRSKAITTLQKSNNKMQQSVQQPETSVFPTELTKLHK